MTLNVTVTQGYGQLDSLSKSQYDLKMLIYPSIGIGTDIPSSITFNINLPTSSKYFTNGNKSVAGNIAATQNADLLGKGGKFQSPTDATAAGAAAAIGTVAGIQAFGSSGGLVMGTAAGVSALAKGVVTGGVTAALAENISIMPKLARIDTSITLYMPDTVMMQQDQGYHTQSLTSA